jgi:hypothetical protein
MTSEPIKVMYHAPLPTGRDHAAFRARWAQHGELGMSLPMWQHMVRYQQFDALTGAEHELDPAIDAMLATARYGGVGAVWIRDADALGAVLSDPDVQIMCTDEVKTFGRELGADLVPCRPRTVIDRGPAEVVLLGQVRRQPGIERAELAERWREHGDLVAAEESVARHVAYYVQNHALAEAPGADGFVEVGFASMADCAAFIAEPAIGGALAERERQFLRPEALDLVVCHERRLFDDVAASGSAAQAGVAS